MALATASRILPISMARRSGNYTARVTRPRTVKTTRRRMASQAAPASRAPISPPVLAIRAVTAHNNATAHAFAVAQVFGHGEARGQSQRRRLPQAVLPQQVR